MRHHGGELVRIACDDVARPYCNKSRRGDSRDPRRRERLARGVMGSLPVLPPGLTRERLPGVEMVTVVAPGSPLAEFTSPIPVEMLEQVTQLVLTDRSVLTEGRTFGVLGGRIWRFADLGGQHAFLVAGLGWGHMTLPVVAADLAAGRLVRIKLEGPQPMIMTMHAIYRLDTQPGPAAHG
jgi:DNA-binding transcriptional LysR family regulator